MALRRMIVAGLILLGLSACMRAFSNSTPPRYYGLDYPYRQMDCTQGFKVGLRIWPFSASSPFDREEMIILSPTHEVRFSPTLRWITVTGSMVSDMLHRDLGRSQLFAQIVESGNSLNTPLEMGGHVYRFAWEETGSSAHAVLEVEVSLWTKEPKREVLFRKHYHLESGPASKADSRNFADAMSKLVEQLSEQLQQDLCALAISKGSSFPAGG